MKQEKAPSKNSKDAARKRDDEGFAVSNEHGDERDVRPETDAQVESERRRLRDMISSVPGVVWEAWGEPDAESQRINFVSDHVEKMLGYTVEEWLSTPNFWLTIVYPDDRERAVA